MTAAATASAIRKAVPKKNLAASGSVKRPGVVSASVSAIGAASIGFAKLVQMLRYAALGQFERHVLLCMRAGGKGRLKRRGSIVPHNEVAVADGEAAQMKVPRSVGLGEIRRVQHQDMPHHRMVNVAVNAHIAGVVERDGL